MKVSWVHACITVMALVFGGPLNAADLPPEHAYRLKRFTDEATRVLPPIVVPPPTPAMLAAPRRPAAAIDFAEARRLMGLDTAGATAARLPGGRLGIIDVGFAGLRHWLDAHPEEARLTTLRKRAEGPRTQYSSDPTFSSEGADDHGFQVYRVVRAILPDVPIVLYTAASVFDTGSALNDGMVNGVVLFNISMGIPATIDVYSDQEDFFAQQLRVYLAQHEAFAFISAGNTRGSVHSWVSADRNGNGLVDMRERTAAGQDIDANRVMLRKGANRFFFAWDSSVAPDADYELELVLDGGERLATARVAPRDPPRKGYIAMSFAAGQDWPARLRVKRLTGPPTGVPMRLSAFPIGGAFGDFNGVQTALTYLFRDSPFVIYVGSFGRATDGALAPSAFSDLGVAANGQVSPHVLGPGQIRLDGMEINGTSFASPFLTALYATRIGFNMKNLIERSTSHTQISPLAAPFERSRWGTPDARKVASALKDITGPTRIRGVTHAVDGERASVAFNVTRCCMAGLTWYVDVKLLDPTTKEPLHGGDGKPLASEVWLLRDEPDFVDHRAEVTFPATDLRGKRALVDFSLRVRAWKNAPPGTITIDDKPNYIAVF